MMPLPDVGLMPRKPFSAPVQPEPPKPVAPAVPAMREFGDINATRQAVYADVLQALQEVEPVSDVNHTLSLKNPRYVDPEHVSKKEHKEAVLRGETLGRRVKGTWELSDAAGTLLDSKEQIVARVPHLTHQGTYVLRGNDYTLGTQQRLRPGAYTRRKANGELETHANILPGKGPAHRYLLDPETGVFRIHLAQSSIPLMPLLKAFGTTDKEFHDAWGSELFAANYKQNDAVAIKKLQQKLLKPQDLEGEEGSRHQKLLDAFQRMEIDPEVSRSTLKHPHANMNKDTLMAITRKLLAVSRGQEETDDRDAMPYQTFHGPEDLFSERIRRDHGRLRRQLLRKAGFSKNLDAMPSGALTPQLEQAILTSGLGNSLEEINPLEIFDKHFKVTRMGEGGIGSTDAIPEDARAVHPSHLGYIDPVRTPESERSGVDVFFAGNARKGRDGNVHAAFLDPRTNKMVWKTPRDLTKLTIANADVMNADTKRVPVIIDGKHSYAAKDQVDLVMPNFEKAFSPLANLVPAKSASKQQRMAMGSRYLTQALPLVNPEASLVQTVADGDRSYEEEYGRQAGAEFAEKGGQVVSFKNNVMKLRYEDGTSGEVELSENMPYARKTFFHQTPLLKPGDSFKAGQPIAKSNYTDEQGRVALGLNARVAYMPWKGLNYEDASVISESFSRRSTSTHMYQHELEIDDRTKTGKKAYISHFPGNFDRDVLNKFDDDGVVAPGTEIEYGQPLILSIRERDQAENKIHKRKQAGYTDNSVLWKHQDPGIVTDVVKTKNGPVVTVKAESATRVGDKFSGLHGDKGVVAAIVPDDQMPHDAQGRPFEVLLNPLGTVTRTNPNQNILSALGKLAALQGKPIKLRDFDTTQDLTEWADQQLKMHGVQDTEDVTIPENNRRVPGVATGVRHLMKLHHSAEGKLQGRGSGAYTSEDSPAKGGETGCFVGSTPLQVEDSRGHHLLPMKEIVESELYVKVASVVLGRNENTYGYEDVIDWFMYRVPASDLVDLELSNGQTVQVTRNHEFVLIDGTLRSVGELQPGDDLMT